MKKLTEITAQDDKDREKAIHLGKREAKRALSKLNLKGIIKGMDSSNRDEFIQAFIEEVELHMDKLYIGK